eukprot:m.153731 g.153731  ORF g.153731 m.153731 type:complete len:657 (-) comp30845_c0_seq1:445-2415(-)
MMCRLTFAVALAIGTASATVFPEGAPRYWPQFGGNRNVSLLDGQWAYGYVPFEAHFDSMNPSFTPKDGPTPNTTAVPSCMDVVAGGAPGYLGPRGVAMYRTTFDTSTVVPMRLQFQACSFYCRVFVNGKEIGDHRAGGYVAFHLDVPSEVLEAGSNELFVLADNRFNSTTAPLHTGGDFWHYGGLMRSVELHTMAEKPVLWRAYVQPANSDVTDPDQTASPDTVDITLTLSAASDAGSTIDFTVAFDDGTAMDMSGTVSANGTVVAKGVKVPDAKLWSPTQPNLHTVAVTFRGGVVTERFGLRSFGTNKDARLTINGKVTKLVGWNHHTQWPITAASPTDDQIDADVALLKKGNANYVRGAHYPHDPRMMDRLDEAGIVFWSETIGPSVSLENTQDPVFMKFQLQQLAEMLDNAMNHASVLTWGWFNEGPSNSVDACPAYGQCNDYARARDPSRFTTWADDKDLGGKCYEHATLISFNNYPGWYNREGDKDAPLSWNSVAASVQAGTTNGTKGKPFVISETGAGGLFEWSDNATDAKWTLKYQSEIIIGDVNVAISNINISGITLWHFYDFKVDNCGNEWPCHGKPGQENNTHCEYDHPPPTTFAELEAVGPPNCTYIEINGRPGGENHKGSLDFWRREKPAFGMVAAKYANANAN